MAKSTRHSAILIGAYIATSVLNYAFGVGLSWFFSPDQFGVLGVAQSLLLLVALAVGSGFTWTAAQDIAANGLNEDTRRRFRWLSSPMPRLALSWLWEYGISTSKDGFLWATLTGT
jgi:O-antigen/teichoic acid export membrane protein